MSTATLTADAPRSREAVRLHLEQSGLSIADWARSHGFPPAAVVKVLARPGSGRRGASHRIAVALGIKSGSAAPVSDDRATGMTGGAL